MHILILPSWYVSTYNPLSGIFFKEQAEALASFGHKVGVIAIQPISLRQVINKKTIHFGFFQYEDNNVQTMRIQFPAIPKVRGLNNVLRLILGKRLFRKYLKVYGKPDIIHVHSFEAGVLALWIKEHYGIKYVVTEHSSGLVRNLYTKGQLNLARKVFEGSSCNIAVSEQFCKFLSKMFRINFIYIPNMVDTDFFSLKHDKNKKSKIFKFLNVGSLDSNKNQSMLIKAFYKVFKSNKFVKLIIVGSGPEHENLKNLINKLNLNNQVILFGQASRKQVRDLMHESDCLVLSSIFETFGVVLIEAMSCGLPVIATKCGGPETIVKDNKVGILCNINESSLSNAMSFIYSYIHKFYPTLIRQYVIDNFSRKIVVKNFVNIYLNILNEVCEFS